MVVAGLCFSWSRLSAYADLTKEGAAEIRAEAELDNFADAQVLITKPLCIRCEDAALLEQALRLYQGRALYDGPLGEEALKPLAQKYGVIY